MLLIYFILRSSRLHALTSPMALSLPSFPTIGTNPVISCSSQAALQPALESSPPLGGDSGDVSFK